MPKHPFLAFISNTAIIVLYLKKKRGIRMNKYVLDFDHLDKTCVIKLNKLHLGEGDLGLTWIASFSYLIETEEYETTGKIYGELKIGSEKPNWHYDVHLNDFVSFSEDKQNEQLLKQYLDTLIEKITEEIIIPYETHSALPVIENLSLISHRKFENQEGFVFECKVKGFLEVFRLHVDKLNSPTASNASYFSFDYRSFWELPDDVWSVSFFDEILQKIVDYILQNTKERVRYVFQPYEIDFQLPFIQTMKRGKIHE